MALQKELESETGAVFSEAYYRIDNIKLSKAEGLWISVNVYINEAAFNNEKEPIQLKNYRVGYNPNGGEPLTQAYEYMKTLPEYDGATDV